MSPQQDTDRGLLYVGSRITSPQCPRDLYDHWYDEVHVPHILQTSGVQSAIRYGLGQAQQGAVEFPMLALYPINDVNFFETEEFRGIPLHSELLPGPSHSCLDVAQFDNRRYRVVGRWRDNGSPSGPAHNMLSVEFDLPSELQGAGSQEILDWYVGSSSGHGASDIRVYKCIWALLYQGENLKNLPTYLAIHEYTSTDDLCQAASSITSTGARTTQWSTHRMFGNIKNQF